MIISENETEALHIIIDGLVNRADRAESELAALKEQTRWIPVGDSPANYCFDSYQHCDQSPELGYFWAEFTVDVEPGVYYGEVEYNYDTGKWKGVVDGDYINVTRYHQLPPPPPEQPE